MLTSQYLLDSNALLAATADGQTTYYLSGIGENQAAWSYYLPNGQQTVRQITDRQGTVLLSCPSRGGNCSIKGQLCKDIEYKDYVAGIATFLVIETGLAT